NDRDAAGGVSVLADCQGWAGTSQRVHALELGHAGLGGSSDRGADLGSHHVLVRLHGSAAASLGGVALMLRRFARRLFFSLVVNGSSRAYRVLWPRCLRTVPSVRAGGGCECGESSL